MNDDAIITELCRLGWSRETLYVWRRAGFQCEYCRKPLLEKIDDYLYGSEVDHVIPGRGDHPDNLALACKACNFIKSDTDFSRAGETSTRLEIIAKAWDSVTKRREHNEARLQRVRELLEELPKIEG